MSTFMSKEVAAGLQAAQKKALKKNTRLRIHAGDDIYRVLRMTETGFSLDADHAPHLRGLVDLYDGSRHLYQCLIIASEEKFGEIHFDFKRSTAAREHAPMDYVREDDAPVALLPTH